MYPDETLCEDGAIYVQEQGSLRCINYSHVAAKSFKKPLKPPRLNQPPLAMNSVHIQGTGHTKDKEGNIWQSPRSLFDQCLLYVAENVECIDSLIGFPELLAARIFAVAEEKNKFSDEETGGKALKLFCDAYGDCVLKSLCLRNRFWVVFEKLEAINIFQNLHCLDLHGCELGDSHDIFQYLTSDTLSRSLSQLCLGSNGISNAGIRKLTAPVRIMKRGLQNLEILDLSCKYLFQCLLPIWRKLSDNPVSFKAVGYLACFQKLQSLDLTETFIQPGESLNEHMWRTMRLVSSITPLKVFSHICKTEGWAKEVIRKWDVEVHKLNMTRRTNPLPFYEVEKLFHNNLNVKEKMFFLQFYKPDAKSDLQTSPMELQGTASAKLDLPSKNDMKRKLPPESEAAGSSSKVTKYQSKPSFSAEDLDLLNSY